MADKTVTTTFSPGETDNMLRSINLAIASAKRAYNNSKNPEFTPLHEKIINELTALELKIKGMRN